MIIQPLVIIPNTYAYRKMIICICITYNTGNHMIKCINIYTSFLFPVSLLFHCTFTVNCKNHIWWYFGLWVCLCILLYICIYMYSYMQCLFINLPNTKAFYILLIEKLILLCLCYVKW